MNEKYLNKENKPNYMGWRVNKKIRDLIYFATGFLALVVIIYFGSVLVRCLSYGRTESLCFVSLILTLAGVFALIYLITEAG